MSEEHPPTTKTKKTKKKTTKYREYSLDKLSQLRQDAEKNRFGILIYEAMQAHDLQLKDIRNATGFESVNNFYKLIDRKLNNMHLVLDAISRLAHLLDLDQVELISLYFFDFPEDERATVLYIDRVYYQLPEPGRRVLRSSAESLAQVYIKSESEEKKNE